MFHEIRDIAYNALYFHAKWGYMKNYVQPNILTFNQRVVGSNPAGLTNYLAMRRAGAFRSRAMKALVIPQVKIR